MDAHQAVQDLRLGFYRRLGQDLCQQTTDESTRGRLLEMSGYRSTVFDIFPFHFLDLYPAVTTEQALQLAYAGMLYMDYLRLEDAVTDGQPFGNRFIHPAIGGLIHEEALAALQTLLAGQEAFWPWLTRCHQAYVAAVIGEREIQARRPPAYSRAERDEIAAGKGACGKASLAALALLGGAKEPPAALLKSYDALCISYQLYDDLLDWRQDYAAGLYSYLVVQALDQWQRHHGATGAARLTADELGQVIYYGGPARDALAEAHAYAEQAIELARNSGCPVWIAALRGVQSLYARLSTVGVERRA